MADFCKQCSIELFGEDYGDFKPHNPAPLKPGYGWPVLCEGCGPTLVNNEGECIAKDCELHGEEAGDGA